MNYATLFEVKSYLGMSMTETKPDVKLTSFLRWATGQILEYKRRRFDIYYRAAKFDIPRHAASVFGQFQPSAVVAQNKALILMEDLLEPVELKNGDGTVIDDADYILQPEDSTPKVLIRLLNGAWVPDEDGNVLQAGSLAAYWGYNTLYPDCWVDTLDAITDAVPTALQTVFHVTDADGINAYGEAARFQVGQLLMLGSGANREFMLLAGFNTTDNTITVARGQNGTTARAHATGTKLYAWRVEDVINQACIRLTVWRYKQKDIDSFDRTYNAETGVSTIPTALPVDVVRLLGARKAR
jgi:hypothetical protein